MRSLRRSSTAVLGIVALVTTTTLASAKEPTSDEVDRARTFFNAGAQAYSAARYADAVRSFDQAYELAPRPQLLFSLAQAERKEYFAGNDASYLRRAIQHYKAYLEQVPSGGRRSEATEAKADLEARLARDPQAQAGNAPPPVEKRKARVTVYSATPGAQTSIDGGPAQELPYFGDLEPGKHRVRVFAEGFIDAEREVSGDRPIDQPVDLPLQERPSIVTVVLDTTADILLDGRIVATAPVSRPIELPPGPHVLSVAANGKKPLSQEVSLPRGKPFRFEPKLEASGQRVVAVSMLGVGAVSIATGVVFGVLSLGQESSAKSIASDRATGNIGADQLDSYNSAIDRRDAFRTVSIVTLAAGGALAVGGGLLYLFDRPTVSVLPPRGMEPTPAPKPNQPTDLTASPMLGPGIWGASMSARF
ncbi:MAG: TonB-dependent receptor [Myxococcaceae bacterium]|nr:TonB-dependent receptor [Myxococcaceae bacterium]